jgi:hypothetical protein
MGLAQDFIKLLPAVPWLYKRMIHRKGAKGTKGTKKQISYLLTAEARRR